MGTAGDFGCLDAGANKGYTVAMEDEWETHWLGDVWCFVRCQPRMATSCIGMVFEVFEGTGWECSDGPPGWPSDVAYAVARRGYRHSGDDTTVEALDKAHRLLHGYVSWDGQAHLYWGEADDKGYWYVGDAGYAQRAGLLLAHLWRLAWLFYLPESPEQDFTL